MYILCRTYIHTELWKKERDFPLDVTLLQISSAFDAHDGTDVQLATVQEVIEDAQDADAEEHDEGPVEGGAVDGCVVGPKGPEEGKGDVQEPDDVDGDAEAAEGPARGRQELRVVDAAVEDAADGDAVREHEGHDLQRDDGVERHVGPDVDEREQSADQARQQHRVGRDLPRRVHGRDPARKGQAAVASKRERLTGRRRVERHVAGHHQHQHHDGQRVHPARRHRLVEDVNEGKAGFVVERVLH